MSDTVVQTSAILVEWSSDTFDNGIKTETVSTFCLPAFAVTFLPKKSSKSIHVCQSYRHSVVIHRPTYGVPRKPAPCPSTCQNSRFSIALLSCKLHVQFELSRDVKAFRSKFWLWPPPRPRNVGLCLDLLASVPINQNFASVSKYMS